MICAGNSAFQDRVEILGRVDVGITAEAGAFVRDRVVVRKLGSDFRVDCAFVRHERGCLAGVGVDDRAKSFRRDIGDVERAGAALALDKGNDGFLGLWLFVGAVLRRTTHVGFVDLDNLVGAAERVASGLRTKRP